MIPTKIISFLAAITVVLYFLQINVPLAQSALGLPFGGRVILKYPCPCSRNSQLFIGPPKGGAFTSSILTKIYREYNLNPPAWTLGLADAYAPCLMFALKICIPIGPGGPHIRMVGTSLF